MQYVELECALSRDEDQQLHLKPGKTDVVFVLDDWVKVLQTCSATPADVLLGLVGLVELKTCTFFKVQYGGNSLWEGVVCC